MGNFQLPRTTLLDTDGVPVPNGTLEFYLATTSTPLTVYNDPGLTSAIGTFITADADGRCQNAWIDVDTSYKVIVKDELGAEVYTEDNLWPFGTSSGATVTHQNKIASHPLTYGAIGDGAADESSAVQSAITNATGTVDLLGLVFKCDSALTSPANRRIINGTLNFSACTATDLISFTGGSLGSTLALTANCDVGDTSVEMDSGDASSLTDGDWVLLTSTANWDNTVNADGGEILQVKSSSGTTVTFAGQTIGAYTTANTAQVRKITTVRKVIFENVRIIAGDTGTQNCINATYTEDLSVIGCKFEDFKTSGVLAKVAINTSVSDCTFQNGQTTSIGVSVSDYSINADIERCRFSDVETGVSVGGQTLGVTRYVNVDKCDMEYSLFGVKLLADTQYCNVTRSSIRCTDGATSVGVDNYGSSNSVCENLVRMAQASGIRTTFSRVIAYATPAGGSPASVSDSPALKCNDNTVQLCAAIGIEVDGSTGAEAAYGIQIKGNTVTGLDADEAIKVSTASSAMFGVVINDNTISHVVAGIEVSTGSVVKITDVTISGNTVSDVSTGACILVSGTTVNITNNVSIFGNTLSDGYWGIQLDSLEDVSVFSNVIKDMDAAGSGGDGIESTNCDYVTITGNTIENSGRYGVQCPTSTSDHVGLCITGNMIRNSSIESILVSVINVEMQDVTITGNMCSGGGTDSIKLTCTDSTTTTAVLKNIVVSGNNVADAASCLELVANKASGTATIQDFCIQGNNLVSGSTTVGCIQTSGDGDLTGGAILGNHIIGGNWGIEHALTGTVTNVAAAGNYIHGYNTTQITGALSHDAMTNVDTNLPNLYPA